LRRQHPAVEPSDQRNRRLLPSHPTGGHVVTGVVGRVLHGEQRADPREALGGLDGRAGQCLLELVAGVVPAAALRRDATDVQPVHVVGGVRHDPAAVSSGLSDTEELEQALAGLVGGVGVGGAGVVADYGELAAVVALLSGVERLDPGPVQVDQVQREDRGQDAVGDGSEEPGDVAHGVGHRRLRDGEALAGELADDADQREVQSAIAVHDEGEERGGHRAVRHRDRRHRRGVEGPAA
jgi:hypothetical protein